MNQKQARKLKSMDVICYNCAEHFVASRSKTLIERFFIVTQLEECVERDFESGDVNQYTQIHTIDVSTAADHRWGSHMYMTLDRFNLMYQSVAYLLKSNFDTIIRAADFMPNDPHSRTINIIDNINTTIKAARDIVDNPVFIQIVEAALEDAYDNFDSICLPQILDPIKEIAKLTPLVVKEEEDKDRSEEMEDK